MEHHPNQNQKQNSNVCVFCKIFFRIDSFWTTSFLLYSSCAQMHMTEKGKEKEGERERKKGEEKFD
jgi:hypothetical protein